MAADNEAQEFTPVVSAIVTIPTRYGVGVQATWGLEDEQGDGRVKLLGIATPSLAGSEDPQAVPAQARLVQRLDNRRRNEFPDGLPEAQAEGFLEAYAFYMNHRRDRTRGKLFFRLLKRLLEIQHVKNKQIIPSH